MEWIQIIYLDAGCRNPDGFAEIWCRYGEILQKKVTQHDFIKIQDEDNIRIEVISSAKLFCISSPQQPSYPTYIN